MEPTAAAPEQAPVTAPVIPVINHEESAPAANPAPQPTQEPATTQQPVPTAAAPDKLTINAPPAYEHKPTGNAAYDVAMTAFAAKGFSPDHEAFLPASNGDFTLLEKFVSDNGIGKEYLDLAKQAHQQITEHQKAVHGKTIEQAMELAGGAERWQQVTDWVAKTADPDELDEWRTALEAGGKTSLAAVKYLSDLYGMHGENKPTEVTGKPQSPFNTNAPVTPAVNGAPLSPEEFRAELGKLIPKVGYAKLESSPEYKVLQQRLAAYRG